MYHNPKQRENSPLTGVKWQSLVVVNWYTIIQNKEKILLWQVSSNKVCCLQLVYHHPKQRENSPLTGVKWQCLVFVNWYTIIQKQRENSSFDRCQMTMFVVCNWYTVSSSKTKRKLSFDRFQVIMFVVLSSL